MRLSVHLRFFPVLVAVVGALLGVGAATAADPGASGRFAVATENDEAARAAMRQMRAGGNAVDAAITAALVAGVASPSSSGLGGGGFALVWTAQYRALTVLDFRETAPAAVDVAALEQRPLPAEKRGVLVGVPGEPAGLFDLSRRFGTKSWAELVRPAVEVAERGFSVGAHLASVLSLSGPTLLSEPALARIYYPSGRAPPVGTRLRNPKLAATLSRLASGGPAAFYQGPVAADLIAAARAAGGALSAEDLAGYRVVERRPLVTRWEGHDVYTMPPPSAGGLMLAQVLGLFSRAELVRLGPGTGAYFHVLAEAMRGAVADRMRFVGDPAFEPTDLHRLFSPERLRERKRRVALDRTHGIPRFALDEGGTHHLVTADGEGNVVSLTTTVNRAFGARLVGPQSGVVLNDELDDFTAQASYAPLGIEQGPNRPRPGARPVSSMTPTIVVRDHRAIAALGGSGGMTIATNIPQVILALLAFGKTPDEAVSAPRIAVPTEGAYITVPKNSPRDLIADLEWRGEIVGIEKFSSHAVQIIVREGELWRGASDPRKHGTAFSIKKS